MDNSDFWERGEKERDSTLKPGFPVHMYTSALFLTLSNTFSPQNTHKENVCVCVCVNVCCYLQGEQSTDTFVERLSLWARFLGLTVAYILDKHQSMWLYSAVGSPVTVRPLQDRLHTTHHPSQVHVVFKNGCTRNPDINYNVITCVFLRLPDLLPWPETSRSGLRSVFSVLILLLFFQNYHIHWHSWYCNMFSYEQW